MILEQIAHHVNHQGEKIAYQSSSGIITYRQLWQQACALGQWLKQQSGPVMVCGQKEPLVPVAFLACLLAGRPYLPVTPQFPVGRLQTICQQADVSTVLCTGPVPPLTDVSLIDGEQLQQLCCRSVQPFTLPNNPARDAYWLFTSGSTGTPKGVRISVGALENFVRWMLSLPAVADCAQGIAVNQAPFSFDLSVADLWPTLAAGGSIFTLDDRQQSNLPQLYQALGQSGGSRLSCTPSFARLCLCDALFCEKLMPKLQTVFLCGETLSARTARSLMQRFPHLRVLNAYGPTEATCAVTAVQITTFTDPLPVGRITDAASQILILDAAGQPLPEQTTGEIAIVGPSVGLGYVNTSQGGFGSWNGMPLYRTGDAGQIRDGLLWYQGRLDRQIKYKGYRIEPEEIEAVLLSWPEVRAAAVLPINRRGTVAGLAAVVEWEGTPLERSECRQRLEQCLPSYMYPRCWKTIEQIPMTRHGKCDLHRLEEMLNDESERIKTGD